MSIFARTGHLSDLGIDRVVQHETGLEALAQEHTKTCPACDFRLSEAVRAHLSFELRPRSDVVLAANEASAAEPGLRTRIPSGWGSRIRRAFPWKARWLSLAPAGAIAATAVLLIGVGKPGLIEPTVPPDHRPDTYRMKSGKLSLEILIREEQGHRVATTEGEFVPGDQVRFRLHPRTSGYLAIVGIDSGSKTYRCHPQSSSWSEGVEATSQSVVLDSAIELDGRAERETIVAVLCPDAFEISEFETDLKTVDASDGVARVWEECQQAVVLLHRVEGPLGTI